MDHDFRMLIDGELTPGVSQFDVVNPATGAAFAQCPKADEALLDRAVAAAISLVLGPLGLALMRRNEQLEKVKKSLASFIRSAEPIDSNTTHASRVRRLKAAGA